MQAVILAAGTSTRTRPLTYTRPKPLLPLLSGTLLEHHLTQLQGLVDEVIIAEYYLSDMIRAVVGDTFGKLPVKHVAIEGTPGTGGTISALQKHLRAPFLVINGDDLYAREDLEEMVQHERAVLISRNAQLMRSLDGWKVEQNRIVSMHHRADEENVEWGVATGAYVLGEEYFSLPPVKITIRDEIGLPHTLEGGLEKYTYDAVATQGAWTPIGYAWDLLTAHDELRKHFSYKHDGIIERGVTLHGRVSLGEGSVIKAGTYIEDDVVIGRNCIIGPSAFLRGGVTIGDHSHVGFNAEIKHSVLFDHVQVRHQSVIGDSVIGSHSNIGAGTIVGNLQHNEASWTTLVRGEKVDTGWRKLGAFLGDYCKTGMNTSLFGGSLIGPASWTPAHGTVRGVIAPFHMNEAELSLDDFRELSYYSEVEQLKRRLDKEQNA